MKIWDWILKHPSVIGSPISSGTILARDSKMGKKTNSIGNYLIQISILELHYDLIKVIEEGGLSEFWKRNTLLVSDTALRLIIPANVKIFISP